MDDTDVVIERLERRIRLYGASGAVVALSGGVDSAVVAATAARALGSDLVTAVTAVSSSYPAGELESAQEVATSLGLRHLIVQTGEVEREAYARNDALRCFHCKTELYTTLARLAPLIGQPAAATLAGANADDLADFRPGLRAASQLGVRNPLLDEGLGKVAIRRVARRLRLSVSEKPALACLSSRVAFGVRITPELLARIDRAERVVRGLGFDVVRVRHFGEAATVEVPTRDLGRLAGHPGLPRVLHELKQLGWTEVSVDPAGYRSGSMNATLVAAEAPRRAGSASARRSLAGLLLVAQQDQRVGDQPH